MQHVTGGCLHISSFLYLYWGQLHTAFGICRQTATNCTPTLLTLNDRVWKKVAFVALVMETLAAYAPSVMYFFAKMYCQTRTVLPKPSGMSVWLTDIMVAADRTKDMVLSSAGPSAGQDTSTVGGAVMLVVVLI